MAFCGVLTLWVQEREHGRGGRHFEYLAAAVTTWVKPLWVLFRRDSRGVLLSTLERQPHLTCSSKKHSHLINHPLDPCCSCWCLERSINTPVSCLRSCPSERGFLSSPKGQNRKEQIPAVGLTQLATAVPLLSWGEPSLELPWHGGGWSTHTYRLAQRLRFRVDCFFTPLLVGEHFSVWEWVTNI